jgi:hypothetical protein
MRRTEGVRIHALPVTDSTSPRFEVEAPKGHRWIRPVEGHFFMAWTQHEIRATLRLDAEIEECPADCDCMEGTA